MCPSHIMRYEEHIRNHQHSNIFESYVTGDGLFHWHDFYELELVIQGIGINWVNNKPLPIQCGSLYLLTPLDMHKIEAHGSISILSIKLLLNDMNEDEQALFLSTGNAIRTQLDDAAFERVLTLLSMVKQDIEQHGHYASLFSAALSSYMLGLLYGSRVADQSPFKGKLAMQMHAASEYIQANRAQPLSLQEVAEHVGLSRQYFCSSFPRVFGCSFGEFLVRCRIQLARNMLGSTNASITEIAFESGFGSLSHFFRVFKAITGITPRQFREKLGGLPPKVSPACK